MNEALRLVVVGYYYRIITIGLHKTVGLFIFLLGVDTKRRCSSFPNDWYPTGKQLSGYTGGVGKSFLFFRIFLYLYLALNNHNELSRLDFTLC